MHIYKRTEKITDANKIAAVYYITIDSSSYKMIALKAK